MPALFLSTIQRLTCLCRIRRRRLAGCYAPEMLEPRLVLSAVTMNAVSLNSVDIINALQAGDECEATGGCDFSSDPAVALESEGHESLRGMQSLDEFFAGSETGLFSLSADEGNTDSYPVSDASTEFAAHVESGRVDSPEDGDGTGSEDEFIRLPQAIPFPALTANPRQIALLEGLFQITPAGAEPEMFDEVFAPRQASANAPDAILGVSSPDETRRILIARNEASAPDSPTGVPSGSTESDQFTVTGQRRRDVLNSLFESQGAPAAGVQPASAIERPAKPADEIKPASPELLPLDAAVPGEPTAEPAGETSVPHLPDDESPDAALPLPQSVDTNSVAPGALLTVSTLALTRHQSWKRRLRNLRRWVFQRC